MTHEEALYRVKGYLTDIIPAEDYSEVEEIIKALEQEPCIQENKQNADKIDTVYIDGFKAGYSQARFDLEQQPCDDMSCVTAEEMQKCKDIVKKYTPKQQLCDDVINRQVAIDAFERFIHELGIEDKPYNYGEMALSAKNVPPVTPKQKYGKWILADEQNKEDVENDNYRFICSECQCSDIHAKGAIVPYCWKCGANMQESE